MMPQMRIIQVYFACLMLSDPSVLYLPGQMAVQYVVPSLVEENKLLSGVS